MFFGKGGAIILGFPDTTQDADLFIDKTPQNGAALVSALEELGFPLTERQREEILRGKDFIPDGVDRFEDAYARSRVVEGIRVAHIDDIVQNSKDREVLPRLKAFRDWWVKRNR